MHPMSGPMLAIGLALAVPASAAVQAFSGSFSNANMPAAPGGRCPALTVNIANGPPPLFAAGTSNFGAFTSVQSHCLAGPPPIAVGAPDRPYTDGLFTYTFASGATLSGTYAGLLSNGGVMGLVNNVQDFVITGGTGRFAGATGAFTGIGEIRFGAGIPTATLTIANGTINAPVPEPAAWLMMLTGFAGLGMVMRRRRPLSA